MQSEEGRSKVSPLQSSAAFVSASFSFASAQSLHLNVIQWDITSGCKHFGITAK